MPSTITTTKSVNTNNPAKSGPPSAKLGKSRSEMTSNKTLHRHNKFNNNVLSSIKRKSTCLKAPSPQPVNKYSSFSTFHTKFNLAKESCAYLESTRHLRDSGYPRKRIFRALP